MSAVYIDAFRDGLRPDPFVTVDEWADRYRILPTESSAEPGRYRTDRVPYTREIAWELSPQSPTQRVSVVKATQSTFTELGNNMIFTYADLYPCPMLLILPTESLAMTHAKDKLWPSIEKTPRIAEKIYKRKKDGGSSVLDVRFPGGNLRIAYAFTTSTFASVSRRVVIKDDLDRWPDDVKGEGNPSSLADKRADAFRNKKIYANSSPTLKATSKIWREYMDGSQALFELPCPECGVRFALEKELFRYEWDEEHYKLAGPVVCVCPHCGAEIDEGMKHSMMMAGEWVHTHPERSHRSYRLPAYYSPFLSWGEIFQEYLTALKEKESGSDKSMIVWTNTRDAMVWEEEIDATESSEILRLRVGRGEGVVPEDTAALTIAADVQKDHLWLELRAHRFGNAAHTVRYARVENWTDLEDWLYTDWMDGAGKVHRVRLCAIDAGYRTDEVYEFCAMHSDVCIPVKGVDTNTMSQPWRVSEVKKKHGGRSIATGLKLYGLNVGYFKDLFDGKLRRSLALEERGELEISDNVVTIHADADEEIARQWTSEYKAEEVNKKTGQVRYYWKKVSREAPNHLWDCAIYNTFLGELMGVRFLRAESKPAQPKRRRIIYRGVRR